MSDENLQASGARLNIEIKARSTHHDKIRSILASRKARRVGVDHQIDTYFKVSVADGSRLKLREGNIENSLIFYQRSNQEGPKRSDVLLVRLSPDPALKNVLAASNGILVVVDKSREIWFDGNVKLHLDTVEDLGTFVEIEAIDADGTYSVAQLETQCHDFMRLFGIESGDLVDRSYSDLLLERERV
jgi:adenylate cyclase class 2